MCEGRGYKSSLVMSTALLRDEEEETAFFELVLPCRAVSACRATSGCEGVRVCVCGGSE